MSKQIKSSIKIGSGAGYSGDRLDPALELMKRGDLDYICFEGLAERTIALAQKSKMADPSKGYNELLTYRMEQLLPLAHKNKIKVITNMGAANPSAAKMAVAGQAEKLGLKGLKIAAVLGDDIYGNIKTYMDLPILETGRPLASLKGKILSANAYLGYGGIVEALVNEADIIITGRVADPSLFLAPMVFEFGWNMNQIEKLGIGTLVGHLLECAGQVTGGYFADPGKKEVPELWNLGFPYVQIDRSGQGYVSKLDGTGGLVTRATCTEQLLYEIHDPRHYITPDCVADFSNVEFNEIEKDKVSFTGATAKQPTDTYKVSVGYRNGYLGEGQMSYGGTNGLQRALLAKEVVQKRLARLPFPIEELRFDLIGINALLDQGLPSGSPIEVRLRVAGKTGTAQQAQRLANEVETLYTNGPAGGGGASKNVEEIISIASILVPKKDIDISIEYLNI